MKNRKELEDKAIDLSKKIDDIKYHCFALTEKKEDELEVLKVAYSTLMWVLGYKNKYETI